MKLVNTALDDDEPLPPKGRKGVERTLLQVTVKPNPHKHIRQAGCSPKVTDHTDRGLCCRNPGIGKRPGRETWVLLFPGQRISSGIVLLSGT